MPNRLHTSHAASAGVFVLCACFAAPLAAAQPRALEERAREHFRLGTSAYEAGAFDDAAREFEEAHRLSARPTLLFNLYLAYRDANDIVRAADALRRFLASDARIEDRASLEARLAALEASLERRLDESVEPVDVVEARPDAAPASAESTGSIAPAHYARRSVALPGTLTASGASLLAVGLATGLRSRDALRTLESECINEICDPSLRSTRDRGHRLALVADTALVAGTVTAIAGIVLFVVSPNHDEGAHAALACARGGCFGAVRTSF